jgi:hypothetical protein
VPALPQMALWWASAVRSQPKLGSELSQTDASRHITLVGRQHWHCPLLVVVHLVHPIDDEWR